MSLQIGTFPIEPGQSVAVRFLVEKPDGTHEGGSVEAAWERNQGVHRFWRAEIGPFARGEQVTYRVHCRSAAGEVKGPAGAFRVGPKLYLALLWHQHQPLYRDPAARDPRGSLLLPWVRLHALRDYHAMAAIVAEHPEIHLTINLTPSLLVQLEDYVDRGATDRALELTLKPAERLTGEEREEILGRFFDADWHNQVFPHPRYRELFLQRIEGRTFSAQDLRDLQVWATLAWFGKELREGEVTLVTGRSASVRHLVEKGGGFRLEDVEDMVSEQRKVLEAVIPIHRVLQERGQIEVSTTPFYHPILPLLVDTDRATIDRPGARRPRRFARPEDADAQVRRSADLHRRLFGRPASGMWPAEGAVSQSVVPFFSRHGVRWVATDRGVLARSGRWGYEVGKPDVLCQPYRAEEGGHGVAVFFRDTELSDAIGFRYHGYADPDEAARDFLRSVKERFARGFVGEGDRILTVALDGENAWGAFPDDGRPFLRALYAVLERDGEVETVTLSEYLDGSAARGIPAHPVSALERVHDLFAGSWIDEGGSAPGADLGTWIGEAEENRAWDLLGRARESLDASGATPAAAPAAFESLYAAEGSDWFWWLGEDQDSGEDDRFDDVFRAHLRGVYRALGAEPPAELDRHLVPHAAVWTFTRTVATIQPGDRLAFQTNCPGVLSFRVDGGEADSAALVTVGGVKAGVRRHQLRLGPFPQDAREVRFRFRCTHEPCDCRDACCRGDEHVVRIAAPEGP